MNQHDYKKIELATAKMYSRLTDSLKRNTPSTNGFTAILDMTYQDYGEYKSLEQLEAEHPNLVLHPMNTCGQTLNCICGKSHINRISIMKYPNSNQPWKNILLGSECIETTKEFLKDVEGVDEVREKLDTWSSTIKEAKKRYSHRQCIACGEYNVK